VLFRRRGKKRKKWREEKEEKKCNFDEKKSSLGDFGSLRKIITLGVNKIKRKEFKKKRVL
jgi:hypothetical protein